MDLQIRTLLKEFSNVKFVTKGLDYQGLNKSTESGHIPLKVKEVGSYPKTQSTLLPSQETTMNYATKEIIRFFCEKKLRNFPSEKRKDKATFAPALFRHFLSFAARDFSSQNQGNKAQDSHDLEMKN